MNLPPSFAFLSGGGVAGEVMRSIDWAQTPVGPIETWPASLRTTVGTLLRSRTPMLLWWGPELVQFYNDGYSRRLGTGEHQVAIGGRGRDCAPEVWAILGPLIDASMSRGETSSREDVLVPLWRDGELEEAYWTYDVSSVFDDVGGIGGALVVCIETTGRVLAARGEQAVLAEAERERSRVLSFFAQAPAAICIHRGPSLIFEFANECYLRLVRRTGLVGKTLLEALPELKGQGIDDLLRNVMTTGEPLISRELRSVLDGDGLTCRYFTYVVSPFPESNGTIDSVSVFAFDVTEQVVARCKAEDLAVQLERALVGEHAARQAAEVASRAKEDFLATISHELRTPLTAMLGWARMLLDGKVSPSKLQHALTVIERNAVAQTRLIDDLLDMSRIVAGNMRLQLEEIELVRLVEAAIDVVRPVLDAKGIELRAALSPVASPVMGDAIRLQQVIWNLLGNAVKFTPRGGRVQVTLTADDSGVALRVDDNGKGISAAFLPRVFERFQQAEKANHRSPGGLGLGLAISRHLAELHRGRLEAFSEGEGHGASFVLTLPFAAVVEATSILGSTPRGEPDSGAAGELEGLRVLVVDDDDDARDGVSSLLSGHGAIPIAVQNVADALDALVQYRPDVVISDIGMPGEDGYSFIRRARRLPPESGAETPAAALTAHTGEAARAQALVAGYQAHISKPVSPAQLVAAVADLARLARLTK